MKRMFTGIQPTSDLTIANYISLKNFVANQTGDSIYCVVDLHALTLPKDPEELRRKSEALFALFMEAGVDIQKSILFMQSHVPAHSELSWLLTCNSTMGELNRMTQFKEKSASLKSVPTGIFMYPVLMAADILLYDIDEVPVGADQKQHVELTRDIAIRMNSQFGEDLFVVPKPVIARVEDGAKIMSLDQPAEKKMSKSNPNLNSKIGMNYTPDQVKKAIAKATTDSEGTIRYDVANKAGVSNLMVIYSRLTDLTLDEIERKFSGCGYGVFKSELTDVVVDFLTRSQNRVEEILASGRLQEYAALGAEKANERAQTVLQRVKHRLGLYTLTK